MANRKILLKRRKSARNIRKITRTMQLIATARFQQALNRATSARPYAQKLTELVEDIAQSAEGVDHPLLATHEEVPRSQLIVLTSMRGLCGGYNANILRRAVQFLKDNSDRGVEHEVHMFGKKGIAYFRFLRRPMARQTPKVSDTPRFTDVEPIANEAMDRFKKGQVASVHVAYMRFLSAGQQRPEVMQLLPLSGHGAKEGEDAEASGQAQYEFSPEPKRLLDELLPATVRVRLFQCFTDAAVSEQVARMVAMKAATDAANEMIKSLTQKYNRARQTYITMELLDIVGGANALE